MKRWCLDGLLLMLLPATVQAGEPLVTLRLWNEKAAGESPFPHSQEDST